MERLPRRDGSPQPASPEKPQELRIGLRSNQVNRVVADKQLAGRVRTGTVGFLASLQADFTKIGGAVRSSQIAPVGHAHAARMVVAISIDIGHPMPGSFLATLVERPAHLFTKLLLRPIALFAFLNWELGNWSQPR